MGNPISKLRKELDQADEEQAKMQERLNVLEKMVNFHLENAKNEMLAGERTDQEIDTGTVVEFSKQVNITVTSEPNPELEDAVNDFFSGNLSGGFGKLISVGIEAVLGNASMGEHEGSNMFIQWHNNALLRLDAFYYRWNFSSTEIIKDVEGASGVIVIKRVINLVNTDPQVLTWAISRQANMLGTPDSASEMIDDAVAIIKKVSDMQLAVHQVEIQEQSQGVGTGNTS